MNLPLYLSVQLLNSLTVLQLHVHHILTEPPPLVLQPHQAGVVYHGVIHCNAGITSLVLFIVPLSTDTARSPVESDGRMMTGGFSPDKSGVVRWRIIHSLQENIRKVMLQFIYVNNVIFSQEVRLLLMSIFKWITRIQSNKLCIFVMIVN